VGLVLDVEGKSAFLGEGGRPELVAAAGLGDDLATRGGEVKTVEGGGVTGGVSVSGRT